MRCANITWCNRVVGSISLAAFVWAITQVRILRFIAQMVAYDRSLVVLPNLCAPVAGAVSTLSLTHHNPSGCLKSQPIQFVLHLKLLFTFLSPQYFSRPITDDAVTCKETKFIVSDVIQTQEIPNLSIPDGSTPSPEKKVYNMVPKCLRPYPKLSSLRL